jgi:hypothetical protein
VYFEYLKKTEHDTRNGTESENRFPLRAMRRRRRLPLPGARHRKNATVGAAVVNSTVSTKPAKPGEHFR